MEKAYFAAGCFWSIEAQFKKVLGVKETTVGYCGGHTKNPSYEDVCKNTTGHAETVEVVFDPEKVSFEDLLETFFKIHDATQVNRQGPNIGSQYRSAIFHTNEKQRVTAEKKIKSFDEEVATEITKFEKFWPAEEYHQDYEAKHGTGIC